MLITYIKMYAWVVEMKSRFALCIVTIFAIVLKINTLGYKKNEADREYA